MHITPPLAEECRRLTRLLEEGTAFTYLRLGDGELNWLLTQRGVETGYRLRYGYRETAKNPTLPYSVTGLEPRHAGRLLAAFRSCSYLDTYTAVPFNRDHFHELDLQRPGHLHSTPSPGVSQLFYAWTLSEFKPYTAAHPCLFYGAEASLLGELTRRREYLAHAGAFWPETGRAAFLEPLEGGRRYSENLDRLKEQLREAIRIHRPHTVFISLASAAKILAVELAAETGTRFFDFGSLMRGLTYSATPGYHDHRCQHSPYLFELPLALYADALARAQPGLPVPAFFNKLIAQAIFDLEHPPQPGPCGFFKSPIHRSPERLGTFQESMAWINRFAARHAWSHPGLLRPLIHFQRWCWRHRLGVLQAGRHRA